MTTSGSPFAQDDKDTSALAKIIPFWVAIVKLKMEEKKQINIIDIAAIQEKYSNWTET